LKNQNEYLRCQFGDNLKQIRKIIASSHSSRSPTSFHDEESEKESNPFASSSEEEPQERPRRGRRLQPNLNDTRVEVPEFEGKLDLDEFLEWVHAVERVFDYKEILEDKKVKLVALRLRKYASLWWINLCAMRVRKRNEEIKTWEKMKSKLKAHFLPLSYLHDSYSQLHNLTQGNECRGVY